MAKIAIDISSVVYGTGVSVYTKNLVKNLLEIDKKNKYIFFAGTLRRKKDILNFTNSLKGNFETKIFPFPPTVANLIWNCLHIIPIELFIGKIDIFHSSDWTQPPSKAYKITTVHDLSPIIFQKETHPKIVAAHKHRLHWVKKEVDAIISPSVSTKNDLVKLGFNTKKIVTIPEAAEEIFKPADRKEIEKVRRKYNLPEKYLLSVGTKPRKNLSRIIEAAKNIQTSLVIVGRIERNIKEPNIFTPGFVSNNELIALYSGAQALVYPSLSEGFGLPILQAMQCGCPVVTSNISSLPEVAGKAAVLVDPYSVNSISKGIKKVLNNREFFIKKGYKHAKHYSWRSTAEQTLKLYNRLF